MKHGREALSRWFTMHPAPRNMTAPYTCSRSEDYLPVLRIPRYYLFARPMVYFRLRERKLVPETKRDVKTCLAGSHDVERDLGAYRTFPHSRGSTETNLDCL